ncbi:MAG: cytidylate kinase family protein [Bacilli bacterium]
MKTIEKKVNKIAGNGIFLSICIYIIFLLFGLFGTKWFISLFTNDKEIIKMGTTYLKICTCLSLGSIGYTVYERFLQATGKTMLSTISQISGAVTNIILDYIFIYPLKMGVAGAAWATIIGQFISLFIAMYFHYTKNNEIDGSIKYINHDINLIKGIYSIGVSAALMQALLAVMMAGMNAILGLAQVNQTVLIGSFGIYYKIQQIALFSAFGLSNTIISILSFNYGMQDKKRIDDCIKYGIIDTIIVNLIISILFEIFAYPLANLFGLAGGTTKEIISVCTIALRISSIGFVFMGISVAIQGVLQSIRYALKPLIISLLRLVIFVFPIAFLFTKSNNVTEIVWWTFPIAEVLTSIISLFILKDSYDKKIKVIKNEKIKNNLIISISREHGTNGKEIGKIVAQKLNIPFYDKEEIKEFAIKNNLINDNCSDEEIYDNFLSLDVSKEAIINQTKVIKKIANISNAVIIGRSADYILRENKNLIKIFIYASMDYKIENVMKNYGDNEKQAKNHILDSDKSRSNYYSAIANRNWGDKNNYDLCIDARIGNENVVKIICDYVKNK